MNWYPIIKWYQQFIASAQKDILFGIVVLFAIAALVAAVVQKFKQSTIIGYLLTGFLIGPHALGLIGDMTVIDTLATLGVILLMFTLGIEFSFHRLLQIRTIAVWGGLLQIILTIASVVVLAYLMSWSLFKGIFLGCLVAMSSSAIVLKLLTERGELETPYGKISMGILIFQDLCVVPMMIILPAMGGSHRILVPVVLAVVKAAVFLTAAILLAKVALPLLLYYVASTKNKELFLITIITLCLGTAWATNQFGLSLALGAFLAGLLLSESEYSHEIFSEVLPFKDSFLCIFFISVGMLLNPPFVWENLGTIALIVGIIIFGKLVITAFVVLLFRHSLRTALMVAFALAQIGEFSFVLVRMGIENKLVSDFFYQITLASAIATMILSPGLLMFSHWLCDLCARKNWLEDYFETEADSRLKETGKRLSQHVIICGYGPIGRNLARSLSACGVPYIALELNPATVQEMSSGDTPVFYGDASSEVVLKNAGVDRAAAVAVTVPDPVGGRMIVKRVRKLNPQARIIARAKYTRDKTDLLTLGAHEVIHEEFETSLEVIERTLAGLGIPPQTILQTMRQMREER